MLTIKRASDVIVAAFLLVLAAPVCGVISLAVALELHEAPLYASKRVGQHGRLFPMLRFRTMRPVVRASGGQQLLQLTRVGTFIRNYSLDDAPALLNVLLGDMSLVGPRPMEPDRVDLAGADWQRIVSVRPGLISAAVLDLGRTYTLSLPETHRRMEQDYVARQSLRRDLALVVRAVHGLVTSRGNIKARGVPHSVEPPG